VAVRYSVTVDCSDPHAAAAFWAAALGYAIEDNTPLIRPLLDAGRVGEALVLRDGERLAWRDIAALRSPDAPVDPATGMGRGDRMLFQRVPEPKTVKNRVHLDLHVGPDRREAEVARLRGLGARVLGEGTVGGRWTTMADPEGNEFDVQ